MHVLGFTMRDSDVNRFHEIHCRPGPAPNPYALSRIVEAWQPPRQAMSGVETSTLKTLPVGDMLASLSRQERPRLRSVDLTLLVGRHREFGFRSRRDFFSHIEQAQIAEYYGALIRARVLTPLQVIAREHYAGSKSAAANRLSLARHNGYLTSAGSGLAGGSATAKAFDLLGRVDAATQSGAGSVNESA